MKYILAIDQGTTGTKTLLMDAKLKILTQHGIEFAQHYPKPGWVEHDLNEIWKTVLRGIQKTVSASAAKKVAAIGITNQRETICFWDKKTGAPLSKAIVWQDRRTGTFCDLLKSQGQEPLFQKSTGLLLDPYFSGTKINWALKNDSRVQSALKSGNLAIGTIDSFLLFKLTNGKVHATEPSNASRTLCYHLTRHEWDSELCARLEIPRNILPEVLPSTGIFGKTEKVKGLPDGIPISGILGDQQSALLGQACIEKGMAKCTYGTGAFLLMNTGSEPIISQHRLLTTIAWALNSKDFTYALEGSAFIAGAAVQWFRDQVGLIKKSAEIEPLARKVKSSDGVYFVPSLTGLGAPYWDANAFGLFCGLSRGSNKSHMARALLEGIAFQNVDLLLTMQKDLGRQMVSLNVDGGASENNLLMQIQADLLGINIIRPKMVQTTSLGAVFAAGLGVGIWKDLNQISKTWEKEKEFTPQIETDERNRRVRGWHKAVQRVLLQ